MNASATPASTNGQNTPSNPPAASPRGKRGRKATNRPASPRKPACRLRERLGGVALFTLAGACLVVSLPHLYSGFRSTIGAGPIEAVALALLCDLAQVASEAFLLARPGDGSRPRGVAKCIIGFATLSSMAYNGRAWLAVADGPFAGCAAVALAVALPLAVLALCYLGSRALFSPRAAK